MTGPFFDRSSEFMAIGPEGTTRWTAVNPALAARLGWTPEDAAARELVDALDRSRVLCRDGSYLVVEWDVSADGGIAYWMGRERKTDVVRELQHRLKNNLQVLLSLLSFQSSRSEDSRVRLEFRKAEARVRAVARLHEPAYSSPGFSEVEFGAYLWHLVRDLAPGATVEAEDVVLSMEHAVPLALIANELVLAAVEKNAELSLALHYEDSERLCLSVTGGGAPGELVNLMVEQLRGELRATECEGAQLSVSFRLRTN